MELDSLLLSMVENVHGRHLHIANEFQESNVISLDKSHK